MNAPHAQDTKPASASGPARRIAATVIVGVLIFLLLWITAFSVFTSLLIATGCCVVVGAASTVSDIVVTVLDIIAAIIFGILGAIAVLIGVIFSIFGN